MYAALVLVAGALAGDARLAYSVAEGARPGPTVLVVAPPCVDGQAGQHTVRQLRHWQVDAGRLLVVTDASAPASRRRTAADWHALIRTERPDWIVELRESYDAHTNIPASAGSTLRWLSAQRQELAADLLAPLQDRDDLEGDAWTWLPSDPAQSNEAGPAHLVVTTSSKDPRDRRLPLRVRQQRAVVQAALASLGLRDADASFDVMTPPPGPARAGVSHVAIFDDGGAVSGSGHGPEWIHASLRHLDDLEASLITAAEIRDGALAGFDVVLFGGGYAKTQSKTLGDAGREAVRDFVRQGGRYVGICAGAFLGGTAADYRLGLVDVAMSSGRGSEEIELSFGAAADAQLGLTGVRPAKYSNGPARTRPASDPDLPEAQVLAEYAAPLKGSKTELQGYAAIVVGRFGDGEAILFGPHCERAPGPQHAFWNALRPATAVLRTSDGKELP